MTEADLLRENIELRLKVGVLKNAANTVAALAMGDNALLVSLAASHAQQRKALEWYADERNWMGNILCIDEPGPNDFRPPWERAVKALDETPAAILAAIQDTRGDVRETKA